MEVPDKRNSILSGYFDAVIINLFDENVRKISAKFEVNRLFLEPYVLIAQDGSLPIYQDNAFLSKGASACFASHQEAWRRASKSAKPFTIIFEDDVKITDLDQMISALSYIKESQIDIAQLGFLKTGFRQFLDIKLQNFEISFLKFLNALTRNKFKKRLRVSQNLDLPRFFIADDFRAGAHCYVLSRKAAAKLLMVSTPHMITLDGFLMALSWHQAFRTVRIRKSAASQISFPSRIKMS